MTPSSLGAEQPAQSTAAIKVTPPKHDVSDEAENAQDAESKSESSEVPPAETNKADPSVAKTRRSTAI
ncbi:hypothetical protein IPL68_00530 [Candidatus Saccharibacteria bacterium]|nr:MAG: hypothetical protein IPL68_00530 [Candidatus Saccharibacteria bacterium]